MAKDPDGEAYHGHDVHCAPDLRIKYRIAHVTPKKAGVFVALWKRSAAGGTEPFSVSDPFDYYWIAAPRGFFCFPKRVLAEQGILAGDARNGKRGFRLYPPGTETANPQARRSQQWQAPWFIEAPEGAAAKLRTILDTN